MNDAPIPSVVALLICEKIITEANTNNKTLINVFDTIQAIQFPISYPLWIYGKMVDAEGEYVIRIELNHLDSDKQVGKTGGFNIQVPSRLGASDLTLRFIPNFALPGIYEVLLYANDVWIGRTTVSVLQKQKA
jgi:Family of unknown function (DUF6941)